MLSAPAGHWAKIASELPHRTDSQCLSKWKIMARVRLRRELARGPAPVGQRHPGWLGARTREPAFWQRPSFPAAEGRERDTAWPAAALATEPSGGWASGTTLSAPRAPRQRAGRPVPGLNPGSQDLRAALPPQKQQSRGRRRRRPLRRVCWSSSSEDSEDSGDSGGSSSSSSSSEDVEPEGAPEARADGPAPPSAQHPVPDMDLWVPTRQSARVPWGVGPGAWPGHRSASPRPPEGSDTAPGEEAGRAQAPSETPSASLRGGGCPRSADARPSGSEGLADEVGRGRGRGTGGRGREWELFPPTCLSPGRAPPSTWSDLAGLGGVGALGSDSALATFGWRLDQTDWPVLCAQGTAWARCSGGM